MNSLLFIFFKDLNKYGDDKSTVAKRVPILGTESLKGPLFGSLLGPYSYFSVPISSVLLKCTR